MWISCGSTPGIESQDKLWFLCWTSPSSQEWEMEFKSETEARIAYSQFYHCLVFKLELRCWYCK